MNIIASNIVRRRKELKMTQKELAEKLHISDKTISRWETGNQIPDALTIPELARVLDMTIDELYGEEKKSKEAEDSPRILEETEKNKSEAKEIRENVNGEKEREKSFAKEYPNLEYNKILIFKVALLIGVFLFFIDATLVASNLIFVSVIWKLVTIFVFVGIILYFIVVEIAFREFYKRKELALYYERENEKWFGIALIALDVILAVWMPLLQKVEGFWTVSYAGVTITVFYNLLLLVFGIMYRLRMKKQDYEISLGNWLLPVILFFMGIIMVVRYIQFASETVFSSQTGSYNPLLYALNGTDGSGGYVNDKLRILALTAGIVFLSAQILNYIFLTQLWKEKKWNRKRELGSILAAGMVLILLFAVTLLPYGRYTVYDMFSAKMNGGRNQKFVITTATIGIDFEKEGGQFTYFKINSKDGIDELLDRLKKIRLDEGLEKEADASGRSCFIHLRGKRVYKYTEGWGTNGMNDSEPYWKITLNEDGTAYYEEETYEIKGRVDWDGLYELALSEYHGANLELYQKWLGQ